MLTKTTFHLERDLLARLKAAAAARHSTVRELLIEGAELVLDRHEAVGDREALRLRAKKARARLREGLFSNPSYQADAADQRLYAAEADAKYRVR